MKRQRIDYKERRHKNKKDETPCLAMVRLPMELLRLVFTMAVGSYLVTIRPRRYKDIQTCNLFDHNGEAYRNWRLVCRRWDPAHWIVGIDEHLNRKLQPLIVSCLSRFTHLKELSLYNYWYKHSGPFTVPKSVQKLCIEFSREYGKANHVQIPTDNEVRVLGLKFTDVFDFFSTNAFPLVEEILLHLCLFNEYVLDLSSFPKLQKIIFRGWVIKEDEQIFIKDVQKKVRMVPSSSCTLTL